MRIFNQFVLYMISSVCTALALHPVKYLKHSSRIGIFRLALSTGHYPGSLETAFNMNPSGVRVFHPAHPLKLLDPLDEDQLSALVRVKQLMGVSDSTEESKAASEPLSKSKRLPWLSFPKIGVPDSSNFLSRLEIDELYEKHRHEGQIVWCERETTLISFTFILRKIIMVLLIQLHACYDNARAYYLDRPRKGCLLVNHWKQKVMYLTEYDVERGAKGYELNHILKHQTEGSPVVWPPFALEFELTDHLWEPVMVSNNLLTSEILDLLPPKLGPKAYWELIFLLLVKPDAEAEVMQALLDTGLSPNKGLIAYLRLLNKVVERTSTYDNVPEYRQIVEEEIIL